MSWLRARARATSCQTCNLHSRAVLEGAKQEPPLQQREVTISNFLFERETACWSVSDSQLDRRPSRPQAFGSTARCLVMHLPRVFSCEKNWGRRCPCEKSGPRRCKSARKTRVGGVLGTAQPCFSRTIPPTHVFLALKVQTGPKNQLASFLSHTRGHRCRQPTKLSHQKRFAC